jgi:hypothetical protein
MRTFATALLALPLAAGCGGTTLLHQRLESKSKGFSLALVEVTDGPDTYEQGMQRLVPADGLRFLWFKVQVRNEQSGPQTFDYHRCDIDFGDHGIVPSFVDMDKVVNLPLSDDKDKLAPREEVTRNVVFAFPEGKLPTRLACGELVVKLPLRGG